MLRCLLKRGWLTLVILAVSYPTQATIESVNAMFHDGQIAQAVDDYYRYAEMGNPIAFYQLGEVYNKGLLDEPDLLQATIWFGLAAEQGFADAETRMVQSYKKLSSEDQKFAITTLQSMKAQYGYDAIMAKYFPKLNLAQRDGELIFTKPDGSIIEKINSGFFAEVADFEFNSPGGDDGFGPSIDNDNFSDLFNETIQSNISEQALFQRPYFIVTDSELYPDGSARDFQHVLVMGDSERGLVQLSWRENPRPQYNGKPTNFARRDYAGIAGYDIWEMRDQYEGLYNRVRRTFKRIEENEDPSSQYLYAAGLLAFPFLPREEGEIERRLKFAAQANVPEAQYQYAMSLYMEKDLEQAIAWMSKAAQNGAVKAQYFLGRWIESNPLIQYDIEKAVYWYTKASDAGHVIASRHLARIKLTSSDERVVDVQGALSLLAQIKEEQVDDPAYIYLSAIAHDKKPQRDRGEAVRTLERAIANAQRLNWDVSTWSAQLDKWMQGNITVTDY